jgi:hypothetical protein
VEVYQKHQIQTFRQPEKVSNGDQPGQWCDCAELLVNGKRVPCPSHHDCEYVRMRSELVPIAEQITTEFVGTSHGKANGYDSQRKFQH